LIGFRASLCPGQPESADLRQKSEAKIQFKTWQ